MAGSIDIRGFVQGGRFSQRMFLADVIKGYEGKDLVITVRQMRKRRTDKQNMYWWGTVVRMVLERLKAEPKIDQDVRDSLTLDDAHNIIKIAIGVSRTVALPLSPPIILEGRTRDKDTITFGDLIIQAQEWAVRVLNIQIPDPGEDYGD
jgi:hypothetical protein